MATSNFSLHCLFVGFVFFCFKCVFPCQIWSLISITSSESIVHGNERFVPDCYCLCWYYHLVGEDLLLCWYNGPFVQFVNGFMFIDRSSDVYVFVVNHRLLFLVGCRHSSLFSLMFIHTYCCSSFRRFQSLFWDLHDYIVIVQMWHTRPVVKDCVITDRECLERLVHCCLL